MRNVTYGMGVSLDGYIADRNGGIAWSAPDEELHRFHNEQTRAVGVELYGRRMYETMRYWETAADDPAPPSAMSPPGCSFRRAISAARSPEASSAPPSARSTRRWSPECRASRPAAG